MSNSALSAPEIKAGKAQAPSELSRAPRLVLLYARLALGAAFLSAVASRFGLWDRSLDYGHFRRFIEYTAKVNSFMPGFAIPFLAWAATVAETVLGISLIAGFRLRWTAPAAAILLAIFAGSMAISFGPESPLDYSVFSASACAALLSVWHPGRPSTRL